MRTLIDLCVAILFVGFAAAVIGGLGPTLDTYDTLKQAQREAAKAHRLAAALRELCGENGVAVEQADGAYRCHTKLGHPLSATYTPADRP